MKTLHVYFFFNTIARAFHSHGAGKHWFSMMVVHGFCSKFYGKFVVTNLWMVSKHEKDEKVSMFVLG